MSYLSRKARFDKQTKAIEELAARKNISVEQASALYIEKNRNEIAAILIENGIEPANDDTALAVQFIQLWFNFLESVAEQQGFNTLDEAEKYIWADQAEQIASGEDPDNFIDPATIAGAFAAVKGAVGKINEKRAAKGKKPLLMSKKKWSAIQKAEEKAAPQLSTKKPALQSVLDSVKIERNEDGGASVQVDVPRLGGGNTPREQSEVLTALTGAGEGIEREKVQSYMKQYLPYILLGVGIVVFFMFYNKK